MPKGENPIKPLWLLKYLIIFIPAATIFLIRYLTNVGEPAQNLALLLSFSVLTILYTLIYTKFYFIFEKEELLVNKFGRKTAIPYKDILKVYIRQTPLQKIFKIKTVIVQFKATEEQMKKIDLGAFGIPLHWYELAIKGYPGIQGDLLTIPDVTSEEAEKIKNKIIKRVNAGIEYLVLGYPYWNIWARGSYIIRVVFLVGFLLFLVFLFVIYLLSFLTG